MELTLPNVLNRRQSARLFVYLATALSAAVSLTATTGAAAAPPRPRVVMTARALQPGELVLLTIATGRDVTDVTIRSLGGEVPAFRSGPQRWHALVGIDLDQRPASARVTVEARSPSGTVTVTTPLSIRAKRFQTRRLTVDPDFVELSPEVRERIASEAAFMADVYAHSASEPLWRAPFVRPVSTAPITSPFGTRSVFNGQPRSAHGGVDFGSLAGTPIAAPNAGRIVVARPLFFSGNTVVIDHGFGFFSLLAHLSRIDVNEGDAVRRGQTVGLVGATGRVTGPHLHWSIRIGGARVDPMAALAVLHAKNLQ